VNVRLKIYFVGAVCFLLIVSFMAAAIIIMYYTKPPTRVYVVEQTFGLKQENDSVMYINVTVKNYGEAGVYTVYVNFTQHRFSEIQHQGVYLGAYESKLLVFRFTKVDPELKPQDMDIKSWVE